MVWLRRDDVSRPQEEQKLRILFAMLAVIYGLASIATIITTVMNPAEGRGWSGARDLAMAFLFGLLAYKGSKVWLGKAVGVRLLAVLAILVIVVLYMIQVIMFLVRS